MLLQNQSLPITDSKPCPIAGGPPLLHKQRYTPAFDRVTEDIVSVEIILNASITIVSIRYCPPGVMVIVLAVTCRQIINEGLGTPEH